MILVARSYAFDDKVLDRLSGSCDVHLNVRIQKMGAKMVKMMEVVRLEGATLHTNNTISFDVVSGVGLQVVPGSTVKA